MAGGVLAGLAGSGTELACWMSAATVLGGVEAALAGGVAAVLGFVAAGAGAEAGGALAAAEAGEDASALSSGGAGCS